MTTLEIAAEDPQATIAHTMKIAAITVIQYHSMERLHCPTDLSRQGVAKSGAETTGAVTAQHAAARDGSQA
jgi:hypothetical protein